MPKDQLTQELCTCSVHFAVDKFSKSAINAVDTLIVSGFMSMDNTDRHGQSIDPRKFNFDEFMMNPQLWVNHKLWNDANGNEISVGVVDNIVPVQVSYNGAGSEASLVDMKTGAHVKTIPVDKFAIKNKAKGVWTECTIQEPAVIALVQQGRLNAFSWQGLMYKNPNGTVKRIDLIENSLVNVPANQRAVFQIGKSLYVDHKDVPEMIEIDLGKVSALVTANHLDTAEEVSQEFTPLEQRLLGDVNGNAGESVATTDVTEGGDKDMDIQELLVKFGGIVERMDTAMATIGSLDERIAAQEAKAIQQPKADAAPTPAVAETKEVVPVVEVVAAVKETAVVATLDSVAPVVDDAEKKSLDENAVKVTEVLDKVVEKFAAFDASVKKIDELATRVSRLEVVPQEKTALDADTPEQIGTVAITDQSEEELAAVVQKAVAMLSPEDRKAIRSRDLENTFIPDRAIRGHKA